MKLFGKFLTFFYSSEKLISKVVTTRCYVKTVFGNLLQTNKFDKALENTSEQVHLW